jgi:hypothetical protein
MLSEPVILGGRAFVEVDVEALTVGQHLHYEKIAATAGLRDLRPGPGESGEAFGERLLHMMLEHGDAVLEILGTVLLPQGKEPKDWTPKMARETADFFLTLPGEENLRTLHALFAQVYLDFFAHGLASSKTSPSYSDGQPGKDSSTGESSGTGNGEPLSVH